MDFYWDKKNVFNPNTNDPILNHGDELREEIRIHFL